VDNSKNKTPALQGIHSLLIVCDPGLIFQKAKMIQIVAFDNRGAGRSDKPEGPYSIRLFADDTKGLMTALGKKRRTSWASPWKKPTSLTEWP